MNLREYLKKTKLITDGSLGTYYSDKYNTSEMPEKANISDPDRILTIHREYLTAGARMLRTNTFASNTVLLETDWKEVQENIRAGVAIAVQAAAERLKQPSSSEQIKPSEQVKPSEQAISADEEIPSEQKDSVDTGKIYVAGDIGPIPASGFADIAGIEQQYYDIAKQMTDLGLDILIFETFPETEHILPAIRRIKKEMAEQGRELFIITQFAVNQFGYSSAGLSARKLLQDSAKVDEIDAIGLNCGIGPAHMCQLLEKMNLPRNKYLTTLPNAGYPKLNRKQIRFGNSPAYFAMKMEDLSALGSDILGGCCGTDPTFISRMHENLNLSQQNKPLTGEQDETKRIAKKNAGFLYEEDGSRKKGKLIAVELAPPFDTDDEKLLESAHLLQQAHVDVLTFPDSPSGRTRVDSVLMAEKVHRETGMTVMPHICCRDKNAVAIRSLLLGADINDIHNLLVITGDPLPSMVRQTVKAVFNFDSVGLMNIIKEMNEDTFHHTAMNYGGAINQGRKNLNSEIGRVRKKMEAGASFFLTQPVFCKEDCDRLRRVKEETGAVILVGIMPLVSAKNALFMKNEISGVNVPDELIEKYPVHGTRAEGEAVGIEMAKSMIKETEDFADGYYFTFPFNRIYMLQQIEI